MSPKPKKPRDPRRELLAAFGGRVRTYRRQRQLTQQALARKLDLSVAYLSLIERGHRNPPFLRVVAFAKALGTSAAMLGWPAGRSTSPGRCTRMLPLPAAR